MIKLLNYTMPLTGDDSHHYDHLTKGWEVATTTTTSHMEGSWPPPFSKGKGDNHHHPLKGREIATTTTLQRDGR
jgi:hypothetical protein